MLDEKEMIILGFLSLDDHMPKEKIISQWKHYFPKTRSLKKKIESGLRYLESYDFILIKNNEIIHLTEKGRACIPKLKQ